MNITLSTIVIVKFSLSLSPTQQDRYTYMRYQLEIIIKYQCINSGTFYIVTVFMSNWKLYPSVGINYLCVICIKLLNNITVYIAATVFNVTANATYSGTTITVTYDVSGPATCTCQLNSMTPVPCKSYAHSSSAILISIHFRSLWTYVYQCS